MLTSFLFGKSPSIPSLWHTTTTRPEGLLRLVGLGCSRPEEAVIVIHVHFPLAIPSTTAPQSKNTNHKGGAINATGVSSSSRIIWRGVGKLNGNLQLENPRDQVQCVLINNTKCLSTLTRATLGLWWSFYKRVYIFFTNYRTLSMSYSRAIELLVKQYIFRPLHGTVKIHVHTCIYYMYIYKRPSLRLQTTHRKPLGLIRCKRSVLPPYQNTAELSGNSN
ncbi:hypothetical protein DFP73DRAFT_552435, partial [Morchella snyderi]